MNRKRLENKIENDPLIKSAFQKIKKNEVVEGLDQLAKKLD